jgi:hypothetical protein
MTTHEGGCLCGAVRYRLEGDPIVSGACYCRDCQRVAGGGAAYAMMYPADALTVTKGSPRSFASKADSGSDVFRSFCPDCGVHLFSHNSAHPEFRAVKVGTLDDPGWFRAQGAAWTASAQPWHHLDPDLPSWETQPDL